MVAKFSRRRSSTDATSAGCVSHISRTKKTTSSAAEVDESPRKSISRCTTLDATWGRGGSGVGMGHKSKGRAAAGRPQLESEAAAASASAQSTPPPPAARTSGNLTAHWWIAPTSIWRYSGPRSLASLLEDCVLMISFLSTITTSSMLLGGGGRGKGGGGGRVVAGGCGEELENAPPFTSRPASSPGCAQQSHQAHHPAKQQPSRPGKPRAPLTASR
jgi:hypothetical protein